MKYSADEMFCNFVAIEVKQSPYRIILVRTICYALHASQRDHRVARF